MKKRKRNIYLIIILIINFFMGVGYASVNSSLLGFNGTANANLQSGIFITEVSYDNSVSTNYNNSKILNVYQTLLSSSISLSQTDANSSITYKITVYNSNSSKYTFDRVTYLISETTYDNEDITFKLDGLECGDILNSKQSLTFSITFYYKNNVLSQNNNLNSILNFNFEYITSPVLTSNMVPVTFNNGSWAKIDKASNEWHDYINGKWANAVTYDHNLVSNQVTNDTEIKQFNGTSDYYVLGSSNYNFGKSISVMARFKLYEYGTDTQILVSNVESAGFMLHVTSKNTIMFRIRDGVNAVNMNISSQKVELNKWYTVVGTYDGSMMRLYVNGVLEATLEYTGDISISKAPITIGGNPNGNGEVTASFFKGAISEAAVIREPVSESDIAQEYGPTPHHIPTKHKTLYYLKFDADNGILANSPKYESDGMAFDGVDDYISVGYSDYDFNNAFSIGARLKINAYSDGEYSIFGNPQNGGLNLFKSVNNTFAIAVYDTNTSGYINLDTTFTPELNTWYTLMATYDGTALRLYVNGNQDSFTEVKINMQAVTTPFMISVNPNLNYKLGGGYVDGKISDIILVDEALTASQIETYYSNDLLTIVSDKTLISYNLRSYESRDNGTVIPDEMINAMWVWIPKFNAVTPTEAGAIDLKVVDPAKSGHDAFSFFENQVEGFWIGKFENCANVFDQNANSNILIKSNSTSLVNKSISNYFTQINNITSLTDIYGFDTTSNSVVNTHLIKNNEWAAVAYFTQSKYGLYNYGNYDQIDTDSTSSTETLDYITNAAQSTTKNVYGIYDLNSGVSEYVMGNYNNSLNSLDGFSALPDSNYFSVYTTENNYLSSNLQHALFETNNLFNSSTSNFVSNTAPWLVRNGLFSYDSSSGENSDQVGSRTILTVK